MNGEKHTKLVQTRVPVELAVWLSKFARKEGLSDAAALRLVLQERADGQKAAAPPTVQGSRVESLLEAILGELQKQNPTQDVPMRVAQAGDATITSLSKTRLALAPSAHSRFAGLNAKPGMTCARCAYASDVYQNTVRCSAAANVSVYAGATVEPDGFCDGWRIATDWVLAERVQRV